jgi:hypothetical protein
MGKAIAVRRLELSVSELRYQAGTAEDSTPFSSLASAWPLMATPLGGSAPCQQGEAAKMLEDADGCFADSWPERQCRGHIRRNI